MIAQKSPKRAIVQKLFVIDGQRVDVGAVVLQLNSEEEQIEILKIASQRAVIFAQRSNVVDPDRSSRLAAMDRMITASGKAVQSMAAEIDGQEEQIHLGEATVAQTIDYRKQLLQARLKHLKIKIERDGFAVNSDAAAKHLDIVLSLLDIEERHFQQEISRLTILAPVSGSIKLMVGEGSPCKLGLTLFAIN